MARVNGGQAPGIPAAGPRHGLLARHYRLLFPRSAAQEGFFARLVSEGPVDPLLDVGCGAGEQLAWFTARGASGVGLEPDEAMFRELSARGWDGTRPELVRAGFEALPGRWRGGMSLLLCLGNTLPHLSGPEVISGALAAMRRTLRPGGRLAVQTVNFDRILDAGRADFPVIERPLPEGGAVRLVRDYDLAEAPARVLFRVRVEWAGQVEESAWPLTVIGRGDLEEWLLDAEFEKVAVTGGYDGSPWKRDSSATIAVAE